MFRLSPREKVLFVVTVSVLICLEGILELQQYLHLKSLAASVKPFYSFELRSTAGELLSKNEGLLKLRLEPVVGVINEPNVTTPYFSIDNEGFRVVPYMAGEPSSSTIALIGGSNVTARAP